MAQGNEASVEEILESIKKVIARDNRVGALEARQRREDEAAQAETSAPRQDEVLDLSEMAIDDEAIEEDAGDWEDVDSADVDSGPAASDDDTPLITDAVRGAMQENLAALAMLSEPGAKPQIVRSGETSLEGLTRELLRPMLAQWLDQNLPGMVEKLVQAEIARIAGKKG